MRGRTDAHRTADDQPSQLDRLLDPDNDGVTLATLARAVGRTLRVELT